MYLSYWYVNYKCCTAIQETRIPSEMCAGETRIPSDMCVRGNTHSYDLFYQYPKDWFQLAFSVLDSVIVTYHGILNMFATDSSDSVPRIINLHSFV